MRIGIDGSSIISKRTGIGNYTYYLIKNLIQIDQENQYVIFLNSYSKTIPDFPFLNQKNVVVKKFKIPGPLLLNSWKYLNFPKINLFTGSIDIFHSPSSYIPPQGKGFKVTTVHDLYFYENYDKCDKLGGKFLYTTLPKQLLKMDRIIVPSFFTKKELMENLKIREEKISVIYEGVDPEVFNINYSQETISGILKEYCLPMNYILFVGTLEPRKNIEGLIFSYKRLQEILNNPPKLVIVGQKGWEYEKIYDLTLQLGLQKEIIFTGFIPQEHLPIFYRNALIFVYLSFYEGFGLPVLEAMLNKVPVIASNTSSISEITGNSCILVEPDNYYKVAEKMRDLIMSHKFRNDIRDKGFDLASKFKWEHTAKKTLKVYQDLMKINSRD